MDDFTPEEEENMQRRQKMHKKGPDWALFACICREVML